MSFSIKESGASNSVNNQDLTVGKDDSDSKSEFVKDSKGFNKFSASLLSSFHRVDPAPSLCLMICLTLSLIYLRPQAYPGMGFIGSLRIPFFVHLVTASLWLPFIGRNFAWPIKAIWILMVIQAIRGLFGVYLDPHDAIVTNDFWHFKTFQNLMTQLLGVHFPIAACLTSRKALDRVILLLAWISGILGVYAITHKGVGPGGFMGDENDFCFVLLGFLPMCIAKFMLSKSRFRQLVYIGLGSLVSLGMIVSNSRGGMLGILCLLGFLFYRSRKKLLFCCLGLVFLVASIPFMPEEFKKEFLSIQTDISGDQGTVKRRKELWQVAWAVYTEPQHIPFGVGMSNLQFWFGRYEGEVLEVVGRSKAGRAVHSMYFELLPELGLAGLFLFGSSIIWCFRSNSRTERSFVSLENKISSLARKENSKFLEQYDLEKKDLDKVFFTLFQEVKFARIAAFTFNCSFVGLLGAAVGISVLYYPPVWLFMALSVALSYYVKQVKMHINTFFEFFPEKLD